ncbi:MAG TPA: hypothetical protein VJ417_04925, partial [Candidatus Glassbacteria bacterium]|nr:hypothetical protein [Candidatus Glassbacteria bacterium]
MLNKIRSLWRIRLDSAVVAVAAAAAGGWFELFGPPVNPATFAPLLAVSILLGLACYYFLKDRSSAGGER